MRTAADLCTARLWCPERALLCLLPAGGNPQGLQIASKGSTEILQNLAQYTNVEQGTGRMMCDVEQLSVQDALVSTINVVGMDKELTTSGASGLQLLDATVKLSN